MFLGRSYFFTIIRKSATKSETLIMFRVTVSAAKVINRVSNLWPDHKQDRRLWSKMGKEFVEVVCIAPPGLSESIPWMQCHTVIVKFCSEFDFVSHYICTS